jgi:hypothetical protein
MRADRVDQAVCAGLGGLVDAHVDAELGVLADHERLYVQIAAGEITQVEDRLRHHAGDDAAVEDAHLEPGHGQQL